MPKISVIIPVYNVEAYLAKCLDSVCHQTLSDIEIICINDCSTDGSLRILEIYAQQDPRIKIITFSQNRGVSEARNSGIKEAKGKYIAFVDGDDYIDLEFYEKLYARAIETDADIVKGDLEEILLDGSRKTYPVNSDILEKHNKFCFNISFTTAIYRLSTVLRNKLFFSRRLIFSEDLVWLNRVVFCANTVEVVPGTFYHYKRRSNSADTSVLPPKKVLNGLVASKKMFLTINRVASVSALDFSSCYKFFIFLSLQLAFRSGADSVKTKACRLLFFFYKNCENKEFCAKLWQQNYPCLYPFFETLDMEGFILFMKGKHSQNELIFENLRCKTREKFYPAEMKKGG